MDPASVLLTGVSRFSKVSLFSGLNNLKDIVAAVVVVLVELQQVVVDAHPYPCAAGGAARARAEGR